MLSFKKKHLLGQTENSEYEFPYGHNTHIDPKKHLF